MSDKIKIAILPVTPFQQNCSIVWCTGTNKGAVVDPGGDVDRILEAVEQQGPEIEKILITHGHIDHAGGAAELAERLGVEIEGPHPEDLFLLEDLAVQGERFGVPGAGRPFIPSRWLDAGDEVTVGDLRFSVSHCPGHTPGHIIFFNQPSRVALVGDVLFKGSIGRTDFPRGDHDTLLRSIVENLWPLGDDVTFIPGHGQPSTIGEERRTNPFVGDSVLS